MYVLEELTERHFWLKYNLTSSSPTLKTAKSNEVVSSNRAFVSFKVQVAAIFCIFFKLIQAQSTKTF